MGIAWQGDLGAQQFRPSATVRSCGAEPCKQGKQAIFNLLVALLEGDLGREEWIASNAFIVHTASTMNAVGGVELRKCAVKLCFFGDIHWVMLRIEVWTGSQTRDKNPCLFSEAAWSCPFQPHYMALLHLPCRFLFSQRLAVLVLRAWSLTGEKTLKGTSSCSKVKGIRGPMWPYSWPLDLLFWWTGHWIWEN